AGRAGDRLVDEKALKLVHPPAGQLPFVLRVPLELVPQRLGRPPPMRVPEPREDAARRRKAESLDQLTPQQAQRHRVEEDRPLARKADDASFRVELEHLAKVEV